MLEDTVRIRIVKVLKVFVEAVRVLEKAARFIVEA